MTVNCNKGLIAGVTTINPDCDCVGIESITQSQDLTRIYINLTNGTTDTFTLPSGTPGPAGPTGPAGQDGSALVWSDPADHIVTLDSAFQTLSSFTTDHTTAVETLQAVGDTFRIYARAEVIVDNLPAPGANSGGKLQFIINGPGLVNQVIGAVSAQINSGQNLIIEMWGTIVLSSITGGNTIRSIVQQNVGNQGGSGLFTYSGSGPLIQTSHTQDLGGAAVNFNTQDYTISVQGYTKIVSAFKLSMFQIEKLKYTT